MQYAYDQLGRLISAATAGDGGWGLAWNYDGFGNLYQQSVTKGTAPSFSIGVSGATNRGGGTHDANGNLLSGADITNSYDVDNRLIATSRLGHSAAYHYSARNERIVVYENGARQFHFYGVDGLLLGVYTPASEANPAPVRVWPRERVYFHGRLMQIGIDWVATDRLGSVVRKGSTNYKYAPYGQEIGGATENNTAKFGTYTRDTASGYDYALNRHYNPQWARFTTPDPYMHNPSQGEPQSWNLYSYTNGDPVNHADSTGLFADPCAAAGCLMAPPGMSSPGTSGGGLVWLGGPLCVYNSWLPVPICLAPTTDIGPGQQGFGSAGPGAIDMPACPYPAPWCVGWNWARIAIKVAAIGWAAHMARKADLSAFDEAVRRYERECGRTLTKDDRQRLHRSIRRMNYDIDGIVEEAKAIFGCPKYEGH